jgi:hypothetical protein
MVLQPARGLHQNLVRFSSDASIPRCDHKHKQQLPRFGLVVSVVPAPTYHPCLPRSPSARKSRSAARTTCDGGVLAAPKAADHRAISPAQQQHVRAVFDCVAIRDSNNLVPTPPFPFPITLGRAPSYLPTTLGLQADFMKPLPKSHDNLLPPPSPLQMEQHPLRRTQP